jgi:hypothetical protein
MKQPFMDVRSVWITDYEKRTKDIVIYTHYQTLGHCRYCDNDNCGGKCEEAVKNNYVSNDEERYYNNLFYRREQPKIPKIDIDAMTLQKVLDMLPEGIKPSDVKIEVGVSSGDMGYYGYYLQFYYTKTFPADMEQYKKDKAIYDKAWKEYLKKDKEYQAWLKQKEVEELKSKLKKLKK